MTLSSIWGRHIRTDAVPFDDPQPLETIDGLRFVNNANHALDTRGAVRVAWTAPTASDFITTRADIVPGDPGWIQAFGRFFPVVDEALAVHRFLVGVRLASSEAVSSSVLVSVQPDSVGAFPALSRVVATDPSLSNVLEFSSASTTPAWQWGTLTLPAANVASGLRSQTTVTAPTGSGGIPSAVECYAFEVHVWGDAGSGGTASLTPELYALHVQEIADV